MSLSNNGTIDELSTWSRRSSRHATIYGVQPSDLERINNILSYLKFTYNYQDTSCARDNYLDKSHRIKEALSQMRPNSSASLVDPEHTQIRKTMRALQMVRYVNSKLSIL